MFRIDLKFLLSVTVLICSTFNTQISISAPSLSRIPHVQQKPDFCGEACVASWLQGLGLSATQDDVFNASRLDPGLGRGCYTKELAAALRNLGLNPGSVWFRVAVKDRDRQISDAFNAMVKDLRSGNASIICMRTGNRPNATEHFRIILGFDSGADQLIYHEPAAANGSYRRMDSAEFMGLWPLKYSAEHWTLIRLKLQHDEDMKVVRDRLRQIREHSKTNHSPADYAQHVMRLRSSLPKDFSVLIEKPFVVIGDEAPSMVQRRAKQTVQWATTRLKKEYFSKDPNKILDVWLFKDKQSYEANATRLFRSKPSTPYGYYSPSDGALVMNIATGGGTLVHEIVHPFIEANFPDCPSWFNEGLGSLYEQSSTREGRIIGLTNWRLHGLQRAIANDQVPSFADLCNTSTKQFYTDPHGTNYAQARYLCYYLQENGLLRKYYRQFVANQRQDPTGYLTLQRILETSEMDQFQRKWERYVMSLTFQ